MREGKGTQRSHPSNAENVDERESRSAELRAVGRNEEGGRREYNHAIARSPSFGFLIQKFPTAAAAPYATSVLPATDTKKGVLYVDGMV